MGWPSIAFPTTNRFANHWFSSRATSEEPREVDQLPLLEPISEHNVALGDFGVGNILTQKRVRNCAVEHVCKRTRRTNQRKARGPLHKSVCVGVQWINSRRVVQMMSFWSFEVRNWQCGGMKFLVAYRAGWCFSFSQVLSVRVWARWFCRD